MHMADDFIIKRTRDGNNLILCTKPQGQSEYSGLIVNDKGEVLYIVHEGSKEEKLGAHTSWESAIEAEEDPEIKAVFQKSLDQHQHSFDFSEGENNYVAIRYNDAAVTVQRIKAVSELGEEGASASFADILEGGQNA